MQSKTTPQELLLHVSNVMNLLSSGKIDIEHAKAQASLVKQSNNLLRFELDQKKFDIAINLPKQN